MNLDAVKNALAVLVRALTAKYDYHALRPCRVIAQNDDGTLELQPDDEAWPGISRVPVRIGVPGVTVQVRPGSRVLLGFEGGDSQRPIATLWDAAAVEKIELRAGVVDLRQNGRAIACNGDSVMIGNQVIATPCRLSSTPDGLTPVTPATLASVVWLRWLSPVSLMPAPLVGQVVAVGPNKS